MPSPAPDLREVVARRVRQLRAGRSWSQDQLVRQAGVSKGALVQIEQGQGNPSLSTLVRLSDAFGTTVTQLIDGGPQPNRVQVTRSGAGTVLWSDARGSAATLLLGLDHDDNVELWQWRLMPGVVYRSEPHATGTTEMLQVQRGRLRLDLAGAAHLLAAGDAVRYRGEVEHAYANAGRGVLVFTMVVVVPIG